MKKFFTILCLMPMMVMAQIVDPIHWSQAVTALNDSVAQIQLTATIDEGWHLYTQDIPEDGPVATEFQYNSTDLIGSTTTDSPVHKNYDENFEMELTYYEETATFTQLVATTQPDTLSGTVMFMACNDMMCLAPKTWEWQAGAPVETSEVEMVDDMGYIAPDTSLWWIFVMGLLAGLLAIFTPCVWPIIPMTVSFFLKRAERTAKKAAKEAGTELTEAVLKQANKNGVKDAILYGLAIIIIYVGLGLLVTVLFGASALNALSTNAIVNLIFFAILVIFALSFFGLFEITLPSSWSTRMDSRSSSSNGFLSILFMAFTLVIVSFSCTGPIIGTLLVEAAGQSLLAPTMGMLGFAIALALPFSLFAMFPNVLKKAPKSGDWMKGFKVTLAFLELALSLKFLSVADMAYGWGILPRWLFILLWTIIFLATGIYLLWGIHKLTTVRKILRGVIATASIAFAIYLAPGVMGAPVKAISAFAPPMPIEGREVFFDYEEGLAYARQENKPVLLDFTGYGCVNCRKMEAYVLSDETVKEHLQNYVCITLYVDEKRDGIGDKNSKIQAEIYGANAQPYYIQLDAQGNKISAPFAFSTDPTDFIQWLHY
ncbi:MAG: thioredoxin family protein [Paludibacteraceae bacterium]|nr:thioredoxin family protein [Paludibacteraceae bacterium]